ncbi:hypothetical protein H1C71_029267, partial [Ictidomys tridecemlineatus]
FCLNLNIMRFINIQYRVFLLLYSIPCNDYHNQFIFYGTFGMFPVWGCYKSCCYGCFCTCFLEYSCLENGILGLPHHNSETRRAPKGIRNVHTEERITEEGSALRRKSEENSWWPQKLVYNSELGVLMHTVIPAPGRMRQEDCKFKASLSN